MTEEDIPADQMHKLFEAWISSGSKARIVVFFHQNPGVVETVDGLAKRLGINAKALAEDIKDHIELGVLRERHLGDKTVLVYDKKRRSAIEKMIEQLMQREEESL